MAFESIAYEVRMGMPLFTLKKNASSVIARPARLMVGSEDLKCKRIHARYVSDIEAKLIASIGTANLVGPTSL